MKKAWSKGIVMVIAALFVSVFSINTSNAQASVSLQVFYDELQPHGTWMNYGNHGYVWVPRVEQGFVPYGTNGYWVNTEYGNTWVSDYSWGWAPFHYGRWLYDDFYGWMWVPDTTWGPAWVAWRSGGGYYGWAPLMPGIGVSVSYNYYSGIPQHYWNFVPCRYITYRTVYNHCIPRPRVVNIINHTTIVTHNYVDHRDRRYFTGPSRTEIERVNRERVPVYAVNDRTRPGRTEVDRDRVSFYKPDVDNSRETRERSVPSRYTRVDTDGKREVVETRRGTTSDFTRGQRSNDNSSPVERINRNGEQTESGTRGQVRTMERGRTMDWKDNVRSNNRLDNNNNRVERVDQLQPREQKSEQRNNESFERFQRQRENSMREQQQSNQRQEAQRQEFQRRQSQPEMNRSQQQMERFQRSQQTESRQRQSTYQHQQPTQKFERSSPQRQQQMPSQRNSGSRDNGSRRRN